MGGKGSQTSTTEVKLPPEIREAAAANLKIADEVAALGYTPYAGPTVAALQPGHYAQMAGTNSMAQAFGLPTVANPMAGLPPAQQFAGGIMGYSPMDLYAESINALPPAQRAAIESFVMDPYTGQPPTNPSVPQPGFRFGDQWGAPQRKTSAYGWHDRPQYGGQQTYRAPIMSDNEYK